MLFYVFMFQGASVAGGCIITLPCDYRIMIENNSKIGVSEVQLVGNVLQN